MKALVMNTMGILLTIAVILGFIFGLRQMEIYFTKVNRMERDLNYYTNTYKVKQGSTSLWEGSKGAFLNYELRSFDGGRNWYVVRRDGDNVYIQGNVENVYPGLLKHLTAMDALYNQVEKNGPLNLANSKDIDLLKNVGFQVKTAN